MKKKKRAPELVNRKKGEEELFYSEGKKGEIYDTRQPVDKANP